MKNILIVGLGRFGRHCALKLADLGHQVLAVDRNEDRVDASLNYLTNALIGDCTRQDFVESLGVEDFDVCIVAIGDDFQSSLETTSLLKELGAKMVVSRASRDVHAKFLLKNGADEVVYPEREVAEWTATRYSSDYILDYIAIDENYALFEIQVPDKWVGKSLKELDVRRKHNINIVAIKNGDEVMVTSDPDEPLIKGETLMVIGKNSDVHKCFKKDGE